MTTARPKRAGFRRARISIQSWYEEPGGRRFGDADDRDLGGARQLDEVLDELGRRLLVVEQDAHLAVFQVTLERGDVARARLGVVHDGELEALVRHRQLQRFRHVAEDRLRRRDRGAGIFIADGSDLGVERSKRGEKGLRAAPHSRPCAPDRPRRARSRARAQPPAWWPDRTKGADCPRSFGA